MTSDRRTALPGRARATSAPHLALCALVETVHAGGQRALGGHQAGRFPPEILQEGESKAESR